MDFTPLIKWLHNQITTGFFWTKIRNSKEISDPIVNAIRQKEYETVNPDDISDPIVSAVSDVEDAVKNLEFPRELRVLNLDEVKLDLGEVVSKLEELILKKQDINVKQGDVNVDLKPLQKELEKIRGAIPTLEKDEVIDYTMTFDHMCSLMEQMMDKPGYQIELLQILQKLENIKFPDFKFNKDGELIVEQGKQRIFFDHRNQRVDGTYINPLTEETGVLIKEAVENIKIDADTINLNTDQLEAKLDTLNGKVATEETLQKISPSSDMTGGGKISIGTSAVEVGFTGTTKSIVITADKDNTGVLYVGKSDILSDGSNAVTFLRASDSLTIDYDDSTNAIYVVASVASQYFWKGALL